MEVLRPPVNTKGMFKVTSAYDSLLYPNVEYTITGCYSHEELLGFDINILDTVYTNVGLTDEDMRDDMEKNIPIYTLTSQSGQRVNLPADHLLSYPQVSGILYQGKTLVVNLDAIPVDFNLDTLILNIKELVENKIGRLPALEVVPSTATTLVTENDNEAFYSNIGTNPNNVYLRVNRLASELNLALVKITELERYIGENL